MSRGPPVQCQHYNASLLGLHMLLSRCLMMVSAMMQQEACQAELFGCTLSMKLSCLIRSRCSDLFWGLALCLCSCSHLAVYAAPTQAL